MRVSRLVRGTSAIVNSLSQMATRKLSMIMEGPGGGRGVAAWEA